MRTIYLSLIILSTLSLQSCFNYLNLNEAASLGKGFNSIQAEVEGDFFIEQGMSGGWASVEVLYARGITDDLDLGINLNTNGSIGLHSKYQFLDGQSKLSVGLDAKYLIISENVWETIPTVYYSHQFGKIKLLVNPAVKVGNSFNNQVYAAPTLSTGIQFGSLPLTLGYVITHVPELSLQNGNENGTIFHGFGINYNFKF